jgi:hypothetical protein
MQTLFTLSFCLILATALFIGNALSGDYVPYTTFVAALLYLGALFLPFISEYSVLHIGVSKISANFKSVLHNEEHVQGDIEIITPGDIRGPAEQYALNKKTYSKQIMVVIVAIATLLFLYDIANFYLMGDGLKPLNTGPISNF